MLTLPREELLIGLYLQEHYLIKVMIVHHSLFKVNMKIFTITAKRGFLL